MNTDTGSEVETSRMDRSLLIRYRVMAFTTATLLIVLVFAGLPLQFAAGKPEVANIVGTTHGILYLVYLFVAFQLTRRLGIPKWQMALVLLAGTIPFCAFVAERKMTKRFEAVVHEPAPSPEGRRQGSLKGYAASVRRRWLSRRALLLHLEVLILAPACVVAGWWQATRALSGNELSWVYSVEWPLFALIAIGGWWHLIHEDPDAYKARKSRSVAGDDPATESTFAGLATTAGDTAEDPLRRTVARMATMLAVLTGVEFVLGVVTLVIVPVARPSGWLPDKGEAVYLVHAILGLPLMAGAVVLLNRVRRSTRTYQMCGWMIFVGLALASSGGLLTSDHSIVRFLGMALMFIGPTIAGLGFLIVIMDRTSRGESPAMARSVPSS
jgi:integral membrane protein